MLSMTNHHSSLPVAYRLYLPKEWVRLFSLMTRSKSIHEFLSALGKVN